MPRAPDALRAFERGNALLQSKRHDEALACYDTALEIDADFPEALNNRGIALRRLGRHDDAIASYDRAIAARRDYPDAHNNRGNALRALQREEEALASFERALALKPDYADALNNRGNALRALGRFEEAIDSYRESLSIDPRNPATHHALIFTLLRTREDGAEVLAQCRKFAAAFEPAMPTLSHRNTREPGRRLRVGYVSGDLREHSVAYFVGPLLSHHDRDAVEVFCYYNHTAVDARTEELMRRSDHWRVIAGMEDDEAAALVRRDAIDILVDLSGHTAHNRLLVFARKPAPVQVTWLGLACTTGLSAMDYRLANRYVDAVGMTERYYTETLVRLSASSSFEPPAGLPEVGGLPARSKGFVTFASFNDVTKVTPATLALWSLILARLPDSRLLMICDAHAKIRAERFFESRGIARERLLFGERRPLAEYLALHNEVDIALDTFPYNGGTTTRNALWMGVPVVTLAGSVPPSRIGLALLTQLALEAFIARDPEEYVRIALRWGGDIEGLARLRGELRATLRNARLSDAKAWTRELEAAYRHMWLAWCAA